MASFRSGAVELARARHMLRARAERERAALRETTEDLQIATDRIARIATVGIGLVRRYWLPAGVMLAGLMFKRARPFVRAVQTGLTLWQTARLLRNARR